MGFTFRLASAPALAAVNWSALGPLAARQQRNREATAPTVSVYRWWARRSHAVIGALLDAAARPGDVVSDPFSGGGTVAVEAARRGLAVVAQDLYPWAVKGLATVFDGCSGDEVRTAAEALQATPAPARAELYSADCSRHGQGEILNAFWVRSVQCTTCTHDAFLFPFGLLTLASRTRDEPEGYFGCSACGTVTSHDWRPSKGAVGDVVDG